MKTKQPEGDIIVKRVKLRDSFMFLLAWFRGVLTGRYELYISKERL
jgi:hypothetical protein